MFSELHILQIVGIAYLAPLSLIFSLVLMFTISVAQESDNMRMKKDHMSSIFWMSFCDFGLSVRYCIPFAFELREGSISCWVSAISGVFFMMATLSWYFIITLQIFASVWHTHLPQWINDSNVHHGYVWIFSFVMTSIPIKAYGFLPDTKTCNIRSPHVYSLVMLIPLTVYMLFAIFLLCLMFYTVNLVRGQPKKSILLRTSLFVGVFVIMWLPEWFYDFLKFFSIPDPSWLAFIDPLFLSSSGVFNFLVWTFIFWNRGNALRRLFGRRKRRIREKRLIYSSILNSEVKNQETDSKDEWDTYPTTLSNENNPTKHLSDNNYSVDNNLSV